MDALSGLSFGLSVALQPQNLLAGFIGVVIGTIVGILPGIGPIGAMALLLPSTFGIDATTAMIMLSGIFYGSMYGGSITSILIRVPGEAASVVTVIDGYEMARKGRAGAALAVCAVGSFMAGTLGTVALMFFAPVLAEWALKFGPPEFFALSFVGLILLSRIGEESMVRSLIMVGLGLAVGTVGMDVVSGESRFTLGYIELSQGIGLVPIAMGLYGVSEVLIISERASEVTEAIKFRMRDLFPTRKEWGRSILPMFRGSWVGFFIGLIPGPATILSAFASYRLEKRISKHPQEFGKGAIEGVAGPEAANNGATSGAMIPLLSLGIPFAPSTAMLMAGLMIHGVQPGPLLISQRPEVFWGVVASMYIGNFLLLVLNLPLAGVFASLLRVPQYLLVALILMFCLVGAFSLNNSLLDVQILIGAGLIGYILRKVGFNVAPLILGLVLGPIMEKSLCATLFMTRGNILDILTRPLTATLFVLCGLVLALPYVLRIIRAHLRPGNSRDGKKGVRDEPEGE